MAAKQALRSHVATRCGMPASWSRPLTRPVLAARPCQHSVQALRLAHHVSMQVRRHSCVRHTLQHSRYAVWVVLLYQHFVLHMTAGCRWSNVGSAGYWQQSAAVETTCNGQHSTQVLTTINMHPCTCRDFGSSMHTTAVHSGTGCRMQLSVEVTQPRRMQPRS